MHIAAPPKAGLPAPGGYSQGVQVRLGRISHLSKNILPACLSGRQAGRQGFLILDLKCQKWSILLFPIFGYL